MKLQSKILVTIVPLAAAAMLGLGLLSMNIATDGVHKGAVRYLEAVLDTYIADSLESRHRLLVENGIADVPSFVRRYQAEAAKAADSVPWHWPGHIFVLSDTGSLVFDTGGANAAVLQKAMRPVVLRAVAERASDISGAITEIPEDELFVGKRYQPWNWYVFSAIPSDVLSDTVMDIRNVTTGVTAATIAAFVLVLGFVSRRYLVNPISTLKDAASQVAANSPVHDIPLHTKDELGSLARSMETMSAELERHEKNLLGFQAKLEERIVERTAELEERNAELESEIAVRKDVQRRLAESESRYRGLFDNMIAGFAYHRIIYDENGEAADYEFIMANPAFEEQTGLPHKDIIGRRVTEVLPGLKDDPVD
jgi:HAMP domain-containing protein